MPSSGETFAPFAVKDCSLVAIATGSKARNLSEMRDHLYTIHPGSIYYHFWGALLRPRFDEPEYNNDFAAWVYYGVRDLALAERLAVIDPCHFPDLDSLRQHMIEAIEQRVDEVQWLAWVLPDRPFHFVRSEIVVFDTRTRIAHPEVLADVIEAMSLGSVFYHFIDARRRHSNSEDDFSAWLSAFGENYRVLTSQLGSLDPYFRTLTELRAELAGLFRDYFRKETS